MKKLYRLKNNPSHTIAFLLLVWVIGCRTETKKEETLMEQTNHVEYLPFFNEKTFTPHWIIPGSIEEKAFHKIPDFNLTNQLGETITQQTFNKKIYVVDFFFTSCPGICLKMTNNMTKIQEAFKNDPELLILSHSVTPSIDSVSVLRDYASKYGVIDHKWHLTTGDRTEIYSLGRDYYFVENDLGESKDLDDFLHTENFLLIDKNKHIRGIYNGLNRTSIAQLIVDIKALKKERD